MDTNKLYYAHTRRHGYVIRLGNMTYDKAKDTLLDLVTTQDIHGWSYCKRENVLADMERGEVFINTNREV